MATALESLNVKIDPDEKKAFAENTRALGTTPSNAVRMFVRAFNTLKGFPFDTSRPYGSSPLSDVDWSKVKHVRAVDGNILPAEFDDDGEDDGLYDGLVG